MNRYGHWMGPNCPYFRLKVLTYMSINVKENYRMTEKRIDKFLRVIFSILNVNI